MTPKFDNLINEMGKVSGPTAGTRPGDSGVDQFKSLYDMIENSYAGPIYPNPDNIPSNWDVEPGNPLPNTQEFSVGNNTRVKATFKPVGRSRGNRIIGTWRVDRSWRVWTD